MFRKIIKSYYDWLIRHVRDNNHRKKDYKQLFDYLFNREFTFCLDMDENRAKDGVDLRYRFSYEHDCDDILDCLQDKPCSVLETIVALAIRMDESIMYDPELGSRTSEWFWTMINNLGLEDMTDDKFDYRYVENVIDIFLNREYEPNGRGGLFCLNTTEDVRDIEIWYQMNKFILENE